MVFTSDKCCIKLNMKLYDLLIIFVLIFYYVSDTVQIESKEGKSQKFSVTIPQPNSTLPQTHPEFLEPTSTPPDQCNMNYDTIFSFYGTVFIFKDRYHWRMRASHFDEERPWPITNLLYGLPSNLTHVDAAYEKPNRQLILFIGKEYYVLSFNTVVRGYPRPLEDLGLPPSLERIDAAMVWGHDNKTYFFSGDLYWRFDEDLMKVEVDYPRSIFIWKGIGTNIDAAFKWKDGKTYFFKGNGFWKFNDATMEVENQNQTLSGPIWMACEIDLEV